MKRFACAVSILALFATTAAAEGGRGRTSLEIQADYGFPNHESLGANDGLAPIVYGISKGASTLERDVGSAIGSPEAKAIVAYELVFPALVGGGALTKDNNLAIEFSGSVSPVSMNADAKATLTPIAFLKFAMGAGLGSGWRLAAMDATGLGINDAAAGVEAQDFGGIVYRAWASGTFQFDLAALMPGDWNHVVIVASPQIQYQAYSTASDSQAWVWEADKGMNFNGLKLTGNYLIGYQMPIALDMVGFLLQPEGWLGSVRGMSTKASGGWGSDFTYLTFGPLLDFKINDRSTIAVLPQFKTGIKWSDATTRSIYFGDRVMEDSYAYFYRLAFDYSLKL